MTVKGFALTLGLGMVGGAVAAAVLAQPPQGRRAGSTGAGAGERVGGGLI